MREKPRLLEESKYDALAGFLGDRPETVIEVYLLRHRLCRAYVYGETDRFRATIVQPLSLPSEPCGYGDDPEAMYAVLQHVPDWTCVCVPSEIASPLGRKLESDSGHVVRYLDDVYHVADEAAAVPHHPAVRLLAPADHSLVEAAPPELKGIGFAAPVDLLHGGAAAGVIISGELVSLACVSAFSDLHADIAVATRRDCRGRGYATAAAAAVVNLAVQRGLQPVWSCGEDNPASLRIARRLGFREVGRKRYVGLAGR